jgi:hypothetical protein
VFGDQYFLAPATCHENRSAAREGILVQNLLAPFLKGLAR